jgi:hypothetical protein
MPTTEGGLDLKLDMTHMLDGFSGNEHSVPITPLYKDVVQLMTQSKVLLHANVVGGLWRTVGGKLLLRNDRGTTTIHQAEGGMVPQG